MKLTPETVNKEIAELFPGSEMPCVELGARHAVVCKPLVGTPLRPGGFVSGPMQFGTADAAFWYAIFGALDRIEPMALTSELSIRFLRPARGELLWARAELHSVGRRNVVGTIRLWIDDLEDRPVSVAQGTYVLPTPQSDSQQREAKIPGSAC